MTEPTTEPSMPEEKKGKRRRPIFWIAVTAVIILAIVAIIGGIYAWRFTSASKNLVINDVDFSDVPDGTYEGRYSMFHVSAELIVTVKDHEIVSIEIASDGDADENTAIIVGKVIDEQSLQVDLVSGPSASQKVTLKAIEEALTGKNE